MRFVKVTSLICQKDVSTIEIPIGRTFLSCPDIDFKHAILFLDYYRVLSHVQI